MQDILQPSYYCQANFYANFFHKNSKKQEKKAGTNFFLLSRSIKMIGRLMKNYLHRPGKTL